MLKTRQGQKIRYNVIMRNLCKLLIFVCMFLLTATNVLAVENSQKYKVLVLPDNVQFDSTNYYIFPDSSTVFASDIINELKKTKTGVVSMTDIRDALRRFTPLELLTKRALSEYKYNYNVSFVDLRNIAKYFKTDMVLLISSQTDVQNYFLRRTIWDFLNIPGTTVVDPAYKLSTFITLVDVQKEEIIWQETYYKKIGSMESRIIAQNFAPATEQLQKIKTYSAVLLAPTVANIVNLKLYPLPPKEKKVWPVNVLKNPPKTFDEGVEPKSIVPVSNVSKSPEAKPTKPKALFRYPSTNFSEVNKTNKYGVNINAL